MKIKISWKKIFDQTKKTFKQLLKSKLARRIGLIAGLVVVGLAVLFLVFNLAYRDRIFPKSYIGTTNFGGLTQKQAREKLNGLISQNKEGQLKFSFEDKIFFKKIGDLGVDYNSGSDQSVERLLAVGRHGSAFTILKEQLNAIFRRNEVAASFKNDDSKLNEFLDEIARSVNKKEKDAKISLKDNEPFVEPAEVGREFPNSENKEVALKTIGSFAFSVNTPFLVKDVFPKITTEMATKALDKTRELLARRLTLTARDKEYKLESEGMFNLLEFGNETVSPSPASASPTQESIEYWPHFSSAKITVYLGGIAKDINQEAKDAQFKVDGGKVVSFGVAQTGYELQKEEATIKILKALNDGTATLELPVKKIQPAIATSDPAQAGISELVAEGKTSWRGSPPNRIHNLSLGASKISGTIVKPGEEFSTLKTIGEIGPETGFLQELVIKKGNQVVPDYGGGLCQVSTTLFRAVLNSGLKVTARTNHSFRVSYYEPPVGMDATIFEPAPDLKFVNDMKTPILIWAYAGNNSLTFQVYGTKDGRQVNISTPVTFNFVSPPNPVYNFSSTMAPGAIRQVEKALSGCTASFNYKVTAKDGSVLENQTFTSKYIALANSYLYGEGAPIPGVQGTAAPAASPAPATTDSPAPAPIP